MIEGFGESARRLVSFKQYSRSRVWVLGFVSLFVYLFGAMIQFFTMYDLKFHLPNIWPRETSEKEFQLLVPKSTTVAKTILYVYTNSWTFPDHKSERSDDSSEK